MELQHIQNICEQKFLHTCNNGKGNKSQHEYGIDCTTRCRKNFHSPQSTETYNASANSFWSVTRGFFGCYYRENTRGDNPAGQVQ